MSNQLVDYVRMGYPHDMHHALFPNMEWQHMQHEWDNFGVNGAPELVRVLYNHIKGLPIPGFGEAIAIKIFPCDYAMTTAQAIDRWLPNWNAVQKAAVFIAVSKELYRAAEQAWILHSKGEPLPPTPGERIADDILSQITNKPE